MARQGVAEVGAEWRAREISRNRRGRTPSWVRQTAAIGAGLWAVLLVAFGVYYVLDQRDRHGAPGETALIQQIQKAEETVRRNPTDAASRLAVADLYAGAGDYAAAAEQYQEALNADNRNLPATNGLAAAYVQMGRSEEAVPLLKKAIEANQGPKVLRTSGDMAEAHLRLGQIYLSQGRLPEARAEAETAAAAAPADADILLLLGQVRARGGDLEGAVAQYKKALRLVPKFPEAYGALAAVYEELGDRPRATYAQAMTAYSREDYAGAAREMEALVQSEPGLAEARLGLGMAFERLGKPDNAMEEYHEALRLDPGQDYARARLAALRGR